MDQWMSSSIGSSYKRDRKIPARQDRITNRLIDSSIGSYQDKPGTIVTIKLETNSSENNDVVCNFKW